MNISSDTEEGKVVLDGFRFERLSAPANHPPRASDDGSLTTAPGTPLTVDVLENDRDSDGDTLSILQVSGALHGRVSVSDGTVTYTPHPGVMNTTETIWYQATDGKDRSNHASFKVTVVQ